MLSDLDRLNIYLAKTLLDPSKYSDNFTSDILGNLKTVVSGILTSYADILGYVITPSLKFNPTSHDYKNTPIPYNLAFNPTIDANGFSTQYALLLLSIIQSYAQGTGTGLNATVEDAIYYRARNRILKDASRTTRRIINETAKRVPYLGLLADLVKEADEDTVIAMEDVNNKILEEQGRLAYQAQFDRIKTALDISSKDMENYHTTKDRYMKAILAFDDEKLRSEVANADIFEKAKDRELKAYIANDDIQLRQHLASIEKARIVYDNRREAISAAIDIDKMMRGTFDNKEDRILRAYTAYDDIQVRNHWAYFDTIIKSALGYINSLVALLESESYNPDQMTFKNYLAMSKIMGDAQLQISALIGNLLPTGSVGS